MPHRKPSLSTAMATQHNNKELPTRELSGLFILILKSPLELFALQNGYVSHRTVIFPVLLGKGGSQKQNE